MNDNLSKIWLDIQKITDSNTLKSYLYEKSKCELVDLSLLLLDLILILKAENQLEVERSQYKRSESKRKINDVFNGIIEDINAGRQPTIPTGFIDLDIW